MSRRALLIGLLSLGLFAQNFRRLPEWAAQTVMAASAESEPSGADAWVLLDRTEIAYVGDGEIRTHRLRVVKVLDDRGLGEASYILSELGGKASKVKRLKGWNLRPDGELTQLDIDSAVTLDSDSEGMISTFLVTGARLPRVVKGSILAFESVESLRHPMGPSALTGIMQKHPVRRWELEAVASGGWFTDLKRVAVRMDVRHLDPWIKVPVVVSDKSVRAYAIPAIPKHEDAAPHARNALPSILIRFLDPDFVEGPSTESWDTVAKWIDLQYQPRFQPSRLMGESGKGIQESLEAVHQWMVKELIYKQVYLSPERGWLPDPGPEVVRHRYGDCKDLTCCLLSEAKGLGLEVHPVMALIAHGFIEEDEIPSPTAFDHVLSAIKLKESLGWPAEVDTSVGRFLLVDPTSRFTPLGQLPAYLRAQRVMICTPGGAVWVRIPATAVQAPTCLISLEGEVNLSRTCHAELTFQETADQLGLREAMRSKGPKGLRDRLMAFLGLPPSASMEVGSAGDPLDLSRPFTVSVTVTQPGALRREGQDEVMVAWGLPPLPPAIQKPGQARQFPVEDVRQGRLELKATYRLPFPVRPLLPAMEVETPFQKLCWTAQAGQTGDRHLITLAFVQDRRPAYFDFNARDTGLREWRKDRSLILRLHDEGVAFLRADQMERPGRLSN